MMGEEELVERGFSDPELTDLAQLSIVEDRCPCGWGRTISTCAVCQGTQYDVDILSRMALDTQAYT